MNTVSFLLKKNTTLTDLHTLVQLACVELDMFVKNGRPCPADLTETRISDAVANLGIATMIVSQLNKGFFYSIAHIVLTLSLLLARSEKNRP